jgi:hypothetical protein
MHFVRVLWDKNNKLEVLIMIPVGVGRAVVRSYERLANQEIKAKRWKKSLSSHEVGRKGLIARFLLGIRF